MQKEILVPMLMKEGIGVADIAKRVRESCAESLKQKESLELIESPVQMESLRMKEGLMQKGSLVRRVNLVQKESLLVATGMVKAWGAMEVLEKEGIGVVVNVKKSELRLVKEFKSVEKKFEYVCVHMYIVFEYVDMLVMAPHVRAVALVNINELEAAGTAGLSTSKTRSQDELYYYQA